jgi:hypothetical protein
MCIARPDHASIPSKILDREAIYEPALNDFALTDLLAQLQNSQPITQSKSEMIAALLVEQLAKNLGSHLVTAYLKAIEHYYAYAAHHCQWMWKYVIWIEKDSVSASWCVATTAWEDELQPLTQEVSA